MQVYWKMASHNNSTKEAVLHTSYPGHIFNFSNKTQTCEVQLAIDTLFTGMDAPYSFVPKQRLKNVPVQFIQGGGWFMTHPIPDGTPCMVNFAMRGIDHWLAENKSSPDTINGKPSPAYSRLFSHLNATCTIGTQPIPMSIPEFQNDRLEIRNKSRSVRLMLSEESVEIHSGTTTIKMLNSGDLVIETTNAVVKAPTITLDGDVTVTKSLTVKGGMSLEGSSQGQTMSITGSIEHKGSYTINGIKVDGHTHIGNGAGNDTGEMK